jgi:Asp/Glu/hydantoin racemase
LAAITANADCAAAIIGAFGDPGLEEARATRPIPIVGLGESGIRAAAAGGRRFSIVTAGTAMHEALLAKIDALGVRDRLASLRYLSHTVLDVVRDRARVLPDAVTAIAACAAEDGADAVLLGGAPFAGAAHLLAEGSAIPVLDGVEAAVGSALLQVH